MFGSLVLENSDCDFLAELECATMEVDIALQELLAVNEMVDTKLDINKKKAELKVITEGGTVEDLSVLYEEAEKEAKKEHKGILSTIVEKVSNFFRSLWEAFTGLFKKTEAVTDPDKKKTLTVKEEDDYGDIDSLGNTLDKVSGLVKGLIAGTVTVAAGFAAWKGYKAILKKKGGKKSGSVDNGSSSGSENQSSGSKGNNPELPGPEGTTPRLPGPGPNGGGGAGNAKEMSVGAVLDMLHKIPTKIQNVISEIISACMRFKDKFKNGMSALRGKRADKGGEEGGKPIEKVEGEVVDAGYSGNKGEGGDSGKEDPTPLLNDILQTTLGLGQNISGTLQSLGGNVMHLIGTTGTPSGSKKAGQDKEPVPAKKSDDDGPLPKNYNYDNDFQSASLDDAVGDYLQESSEDYLGAVFSLIDSL